MQQLTHKDPRYYQMIRRWHGMMSRCYNQQDSSYKLYGGRGILVCNEWHDFCAFLRFWGFPPFEGATMERVDNDDSYSPANCKWAHSGEQNKNTRRSKVVEYNGESKTLTEWARDYDINPGRLSERLRRGWSFEKAIYTPCPKGFLEGTLQRQQVSRDCWERSGDKYKQSTIHKRLSGLIGENGLIINPRNHSNT